MKAPTGKLKYAYQTISNMEAKIKELKEVNSTLVLAVESITNDENIHPIKDWAICGIYNNSGKGTEGRATRMKTYYEFMELIESAKALITNKD